MPIHERPFDSLEQLHESELEQYRVMFESGTPVAVTAAMAYCDKYGLSPPSWAVTESVKIQCAAIRGNTPGKRGRSSGIGDRHRQDAIDYVRWDMVNEIRENRNLLRDKDKAFSKLPVRVAERIDCKELLRLARAGSYKYASRLLARSAAFGGRDAMKKSLHTVERNMRTQRSAVRYYILDAGFLRQIGVVVDPPAKPGK